MNDCFVYIRVSTDQQASEGFSLDNQKRACKDYAGIKQFNVKRIFTDDGKSGRTSERPALKEMFSALENSQVRTVVIYKLDRFYRNVSEFARIISSFKEKGIVLFSVNEGDLSAGGTLLPNILASVAQYESEANGERTRDALTQKFREGWQPTPPPIGYRSVGGDRERKTCEPDLYTAPIIKELFELYSTGNYSILEVQEWLAKRNIVSRTGTGLGHSVINTILNNPFYYGLIRWKGESKIGNHKPILTKDLFDTCQYVLAKHRSFLTRRRKYDYLLRGFLYCYDCGQKYTAEPHPNHSVNKPDQVHYYHCQKRDRNGCPARYVEMSKIEGLVEEELKKLEFGKEFLDAVVKKTREAVEQNRKFASSNVQGILNQKNSLEDRRNKLEDMMIDGTIDRESFKRRHDEIQQQIVNLDNQMIELDNKGKVDIDLIEEVLAFTRNVHQTYIDAPKFLKRHYLRFFFEQIVVKNRKIYKVVPTPIFKSLRNRHEIIIREGKLRD